MTKITRDKSSKVARHKQSYISLRSPTALLMLPAMRPCFQALLKDITVAFLWTSKQPFFNKPSKCRFRYKKLFNILFCNTLGVCFF